MERDTASETATGTSYTYGYARVSTTAQDLTRQLDELRTAGVPAERIYVDQRTGAAFEREGLAAMLAQLRPGDVLMVSSLDRLGRSLHKMLGLVEELRAQGVHLVTVGGGIPLDTRQAGPGTEMALLMLAFLSEVELIYQRERRASARASREQRGVTWGRPAKVDHDAVRADFTSGMTARQVMGKHGISRAQAFRIKAAGKDADQSIPTESVRPGQGAVPAGDDEHPEQAVPSTEGIEARPQKLSRKRATAIVDAAELVRDPEHMEGSWILRSGNTVLGYVQPTYRGDRRNGWAGYLEGSTASGQRHGTRQAAAADLAATWLRIVTTAPRRPLTGN